MNIVNKLTLRQLKKNKRRTVVTVFGVVISVAMIMAVTTIGVSFLDMFKRAVIEQSGSWQSQYLDVEKSKLSIIEEENKVNAIALVDKQGVASIADIGLNPKLNKTYIEVFALNNTAESMYSVRLLEGRLPASSNEIVIPEQLTLAQNQGIINVGDKVTLDLGARQAYHADGSIMEDVKLTHAVAPVSKIMYEDEGGAYEELINKTPKTYTVVGIVKDSVWEVPWGGSQIAITKLDENTLSDNAIIEIVGTTFDEKTRRIFDTMDALGEKLGVQYSIHHELLRYDLLTSVDSLQVTLYGLTSIIMLIVIIGSVSLIYNAFGISVADRSKYLGMLASVGATKRQKRNSVFFEAGLISLVSIPIGLLSGYMGLLVTFKVINGILQNTEMLNLTASLDVVITPISILLAIIVSLFTIIISAWLPARRASKITAIDAIRMSYDVKLTKRQVKNNRLVRKLFGLEADIALKNLKRNKRRYQITVFSLVISIVLFVSASYFTTMLQKGNELASSDLHYQVVATVKHGLDVEFDRTQLVNHDKVADYAVVKSEYTYADLKAEHFSNSMQKHIDTGEIALNEDGSYQYIIYVFSLDDESFNEYVEEQQLTATNWYDANHLNAVLINHTIYNSKIETKKIEDIMLKNADNLELSLYDEESDVSGNVIKRELPSITIANVVNEPPVWLSSSSSMNVVYLVMPESQFKTFNEASNNKFEVYEVYVQSDEPSVVAQYMLESEFDDVELSVWNVQEYGEQMKGIVIILNIFTYGFITLITFISLANIMNTISTGLQLRKREFAMLRSMGMTEKGFYKMINYESIFYGIKSLAYGIPISFAFVYLMYWSMTQSMDFKFEMPWLYYAIAIVGIFIIVTLVMYYAGSKIKKGSIVEAIKQENV